MVFYIQKNLNFTVVTMKEELWLCATAGGEEKVKIFFFCIIANIRKKNILTLCSFCAILKNWNIRTKNESWLTLQYSCSTTLNISTLKCQLSKWHWVTFINCKAHTSKISSHNLRMRPSGRRGLMISQSIILDFCSFAYWLMLRLLASNH